MKSVVDRRARFRTVICFKSHSEECFFEGVIEGVIAEAKHGRHGFGYDPLFIPNGFKKTFAQMLLSEKNAISHRSQAIIKLSTYLSI